MANSSQNDQNHPFKKEDGEASSGSNHAPPENRQSPATGYPLTMGYPPSMGYPSGQSYNNQVYPYNSQFSHQRFIPPQPEPKLSGFCRGVIGGLSFLILFTCIISVISWLIFHPFLPLFYINNLSVSNFNISSAANFSSDWVADLTVRNPNSKLEIYLENIDVYIYRSRDVLASIGYNAYMLESKESMSMEVKLSAAANKTNSGEKLGGAVGKMAEEKNSTGKVYVSLRMMMWGTFKSGKWLAKNIVVKVFCEDLKVSFLDNNSTNGSLENGSDCLVVSE